MDRQSIPELHQRFLPWPLDYSRAEGWLSPPLGSTSLLQALSGFFPTLCFYWKGVTLHHLSLYWRLFWGEGREWLICRNTAFPLVLELSILQRYRAGTPLVRGAFSELGGPLRQEVNRRASAITAHPAGSPAQRTVSACGGGGTGPGS